MRWAMVATTITTSPIRPSTGDLADFDLAGLQATVDGLLNEDRDHDAAGGHRPSPARTWRRIPRRNAGAASTPLPIICMADQRLIGSVTAAPPRRLLGAIVLERFHQPPVLGHVDQQLVVAAVGDDAVHRTGTRRRRPRRSSTAGMPRRPRSCRARSGEGWPAPWPRCRDRATTSCRRAAVRPGLPTSARASAIRCR